MTKEERFYRKIKEITDRGNTAEVKKSGEELVVLEVKKKKKLWAGEIGRR